MEKGKMEIGQRNFGQVRAILHQDDSAPLRSWLRAPSGPIPPNRRMINNSSLRSSPLSLRLLCVLLLKPTPRENIKLPNEPISFFELYIAHQPLMPICLQPTGKNEPNLSHLASQRGIENQKGRAGSPPPAAGCQPTQLKLWVWHECSSRSRHRLFAAARARRPSTVG